MQAPEYHDTPCKYLIAAVIEQAFSDAEKYSKRVRALEMTLDSEETTPEFAKRRRAKLMKYRTALSDIRHFFSSGAIEMLIEAAGLNIDDKIIIKHGLRCLESPFSRGGTD